MKLCSFLFSFFTLFAVNNAIAQNNNEIVVSKSNYIPYLVGGLNWASISGVENRSAVSPFATFNFGLGFLTLINKPGPASLSVEAFFSEQGFKLNDVRRNSSPEYMKLSYINIPAVLRFSLSRSSNFYVGVGPQVGFVVDGHIIAKDGSKSKFQEGTINKTTFDAVGTLGTNFGNKGDMGVELRFQGGLNKFMINAPDYRHSVLQVRLIMPMFFL